jgi:hypothetical protein
MTVDFSSKTVEARRKYTIFFKYWRKRTVNQNPKLSENITQKRRSKYAHRGKKSKRICDQQTSPKRRTGGGSLKRKEKIKERTLKHQEGRGKTVGKNMSKKVEFCELCLIVK